MSPVTTAVAISYRLRFPLIILLLLMLHCLLRLLLLLLAQTFGLLAEKFAIARHHQATQQRISSRNCSQTILRLCVGARLFAGTVARYEPGAMIVHLREKRVDLWCFSGSPILSEDATQVVGLLGGGDKEKGVIYCNAMPPELINDWLQST